MADQEGRHLAPTQFLSPRELEVTGVPPARVLALGSCLLQDVLGGRNHDADPNTYHLVLVNGLSEYLSQIPGDPATYDYQIVQIGLRFVLHDLAVADLDYADEAGFARAFEWACKKLRQQLDHRLALNTEFGLLTFVVNFMAPQFNPMGRLFPRFDLRNPEYFYTELNRELERLCRERRNCHVLDMDRLAASFGRRYVQDDIMGAFNHNARIPAGLTLDGRIETLRPLYDYYECLRGPAFSDALLAELRAMLRVIHGTDAVKLVVVDLDDTLWKGVSGEIEDVGPDMAEGWPRGMIEALFWLKKRGVLLAIASKNDEARVRAIWPLIFDRLPLDMFAMLRINWQPKHENMREILAGINLLPRNVLFIDDNPAERAAMKAAFPDMRIIGSNPFYFRRILLLAPELQQPGVTAESAQRTEMVQAQLAREAARASLSPEEFARSLDVRLRLNRILSVEDKRFVRALELINKTNQFNTTGRRWSQAECAAHFKAGGYFAVFQVEDTHTKYGLVGVAIVRDDTIVQWVMSCRVIGLGAEQAVLHTLTDTMRRAGYTRIWALLTANEVNMPCQGFYRAAGFVQADGEWALEADTPLPVKPEFVTMELGAAFSV